MKSSELIGVALDQRVHELLGGEPLKAGGEAPLYSSDWNFGGPIVEEKGISINYGGLWFADIADECQQSGPTPLVAAMRCLCINLLGDVDETPV
jgi:hypothetical protein